MAGGGPGLNRRDLQRRATEKLQDAKVLHRSGAYSSAYYLAGYGVEFALKACIAQQIRAETIPDPSFGRQVYTHDFAALMRIAGLNGRFEEELRRAPALKAAWLVALEWSEGSRYGDADEAKSGDMIDAAERMLTWLTAIW